VANTAFEALYLAHKSALERFVYYKMPSKADGDDLLQEVAIAALRNIDTLRDPEHFKAWILKIATNKCKDFYRRMAVKHEIPLEAIIETHATQSRHGITETQVVRDTLANLSDRDRQILFLYYFKHQPQAQIARQLGIPPGTVKSRLHTAKRNFKQSYPFSPTSKGESMNHQLPHTLPAYRITPSDRPAFAVKWEELMSWFIIPRLGEQLTWASYESPSRRMTETTTLQVIGKACVHGVEGVEIECVETPCVPSDYCDGNTQRRFIAQLTDTHCRWLAESHVENGVRHHRTFLDADAFIPDWGMGPDNCGNDIRPVPRGLITKMPSTITGPADAQLVDVVGRYIVQLGDKSCDTICLVELYNANIFTEQYLDKHGRTILWRRFNRDNWGFSRYNALWSQMHPDNEQITVNGELYVHWYDCISDYIL